MQLNPEELGEPVWMMLSEKIWTSRVIVDSSTDPKHAPRSTMAVRKFRTTAESLEELWTHIIPLRSPAQAEALSVTLLDRIRLNPDSKVTEFDEHWLDGIDLRETSGVKAVERASVGMGMTGRVLNLVGVVNNVAFGIGYGHLGNGWTQGRFVSLAQLQADKIRSHAVAE